MKKFWKNIVFCAILVFIVAGCASSRADKLANKREAALAALDPVRTIPEKRPNWVDKLPITDKQLAFVGVSDQYATDSAARDDAQADGRTQLVRYYGTLISEKGRNASSIYGISSDVFDPQIASQELEEFISEGLVQSFSANEFYTEVYVTVDAKTSYKVYALMLIEKAVADKAAQEYLGKKAEEYRSKAAAEQDAKKREQLEKAAEFFGGSLSSSLF